MCVPWGGRGGVSSGPHEAGKASQKTRGGGTHLHIGKRWMRMKSVGIIAAQVKVKGNQGGEILGNTLTEGVSEERWRRSSERGRGESGKCQEYQRDTQGTILPPCP